MQELKLFSSGQSKHLEALKKKHIILKEQISQDETLTELDKKVQLKRLEKSFQKEKKNSKNNLY